LKLPRLRPGFFQISLLIIVVVSLTSGLLVFTGKASSTSTYYYRFTVDSEGATKVEINFNSTDLGEQPSWVFVPKSWNGTPNVAEGKIVRWSLVDTKEVIGSSQYFYQAYKFTYQASNIKAIFRMTIEFTMDTGALIIGDRGIFFSPLVGFDHPTSSGNAEVFFDSSLTVNSGNAIAIWERYQPIYESGTYDPTRVDASRVLYDLREKLLRLQIEFKANFSTQYAPLQSVNKVFTFRAEKRYEAYASSILNLYDRIYYNYTSLFNVTLENIRVQFFLPNFQTLLSVGGYVPYSGGELGEININIFFIRAVNGTIEVIAAHELVHHFLSKARLYPSDLLWFHEGMAQYASIEKIEDLGYEGARYERERLEGGIPKLATNFGYYLKRWNPSSEPTDVGTLYVGSYYAVRELANIHGGFNYYQRFFELIRNATWIDDKNNFLAYYLSKAANASVALTLRQWGFDISDWYTPSATRELIDEAEKAIGGLNPVFQPYKFFAEYLYRQALTSSERGDWERAKSLLQLAITIASMAPLLTFLTIIAILAILVYMLYKSSLKPKPSVPVPPPEILQPTA